MALELDVAIVGYGPCGAVAAGLLGGQGIRTWVCDKSTEIYGRPSDPALIKEYEEYLKAHVEPRIWDRYQKQQNRR